MRILESNCVLTGREAGSRSVLPMCVVSRIVLCGASGQIKPAAAVGSTPAGPVNRGKTGDLRTGRANEL
jgi:hypothetical protein